MPVRVVVEWTRASVRMAVAQRRRGQVQPEMMAASRHAETDAANALRELRKRAKVGSAQVIGVIPREEVITRLVNFPSVDAEELGRMVALHAKAHLPYPAEQAVTDFSVVSQRDGVSTVLLAVCQRQVVERYLTLFREAGFAPDRLAVSSSGVAEWYRRNQPAAPIVEPVLVVNVDDTRTDVVVIEGGRILSSRGVAAGAHDWTTSEQAVELLVQEVEQCRAVLRKGLPEAEVRSVVLTGFGALSEWHGLLAQRCGLQVSVIEGASVVAGALAVADLANVLDLAPPEVRAQARHRRQSRELMIVGALFSVAAALGIGWMELRLSRQQQAARRLDEAIRALEPDVNRLQDQRRVSRHVREAIEARRRISVMLGEVLGSAPVGLVLERVAFERARQSLVLRGEAPSTQMVLDYAKQLGRVDGVESSTLKYATPRPGSGGDRVEFEVEMAMQ
ncbi:MAG: pilus assembly protein PilM [Candidatus Omnitrophica bacterium]|nr:pilus assembly protein PilM [Candidatus Omnitrophota bacterium]